MKLSKTTRKDPTQSKTLRESYRRDLIRLFASYRRDALKALQQSAEAGSRMLAAADIDLIRLDETLRALGAALVMKGTPITRDHVLSNYTAGTGFGTKQLNRIGVEAVIGEGPADWRAMDALKVRNLSALRGVTEEMNKQIIRELGDGIQQGESMPKLAKRLTDRVDHIGKTRAKTMAHHETMKAFNQGAELRYAQAGVEILEWISAHDPPRVCEECLALDTTTFRIKSNHIRPPDVHVGCRCGILPVLGKPKIVTKEDSVRNLTDNIHSTQETVTKARREYNSVRKWNTQWRNDLRSGVRVMPNALIRGITGKKPDYSDLKKWHNAFREAELRGDKFLTPAELKLLGKWGKKKGFKDKILKEMAISGKLNRYDNDLDDLLMELRAVKKGRYLGSKAAVTKYEKRVWDRYSEELYLVDKNGQRVYYSSSEFQGAAGFADITGSPAGGTMILNRVDPSIIMLDDYVRDAARLNLAQVRMVTPDKTYIIARTGKWDEKYYAEVIRPAYLKAKRDVVAEGKLKNPIAIDREVWRRTVRECDEIDYDEVVPAPLVPRKVKTEAERAIERAEKQKRETQRLQDLLKSIAEE